MKITSKLLRSRIAEPLDSVLYLDLSNLNIECIEKLGACSKLTVLNLRENYIDYVDNLECCPQLWKIDLANNQVKCADKVVDIMLQFVRRMVRNLEGFSRFLALGSLILCNNNLSWNSLARIRHMHILELSLHGNPELECTAYYRFHVIDCLPRIWTLDGRIITSTERVQVKQFFHDSALNRNPTRHKLVSRPFTSTAFKQIRQNGVFGERTNQLMLSFPESGVLNSDMDYRRLGYLSYNLQEDLLIEGLESERIAKVMAHNERILEELLAARQHDRYRCGRVLLLLVGSLEFAIPTQLMAEALTETGLGTFGNLPVMQLFMLPKEARCTITCLLLNAVKVDRDAGKQGGLSDKMYVAAHNVMFRLVKKSQGGVSAYKKVVRRELNATKMGRCLIASEITQLLAYVPNFFEFLMNDQGLLQLVLVASPNDGTKNKIIRMLKQMHDGETEVQKIYRDAANTVLCAVKQSASLGHSSDKLSQQEAFLLNTCKALPRRPPSLPIFSAKYLASGKSTPDLRPTRVRSCKGIQKNPKVQARLGDHVLLGALNIAKIIAMPESDLLLVQMDRIPAETCGMMKTAKDQKDHYMYVDRKDLEWDFQCGYWRPIGTVGDIITITGIQEKNLACERAGREKEEGRDEERVEGREEERDEGREEGREERENSGHVSQTSILMPPNNSSSEDNEEDEDSLAEDNNEETEDKKRQIVSDSPVEILKQLLRTQKLRPSAPRGTPKDSLDETDPEPRPRSAKFKRIMSRDGKSLMCIQSSPLPTVSRPSLSLLTTSESDDELVFTPTSGGTTLVNPSRRSSLESAEEKELRALQSCPSTAYSALRSSASHDVTSLSKSSPRHEMSEGEEEEEEGEEEYEGRKGAGERQPMEFAFKQMFLSPRRMSITRLLSLAAKHSVPGSEALAPRVTGNTQRKPQQTVTPPPQPPPSPIMTQLQVLHMKTVNSWLGAGKNLHNRPRRPGHTPGWKEGMPLRQVSSAAHRAMNRTSAPNIITPSSLIYDHTIGNRSHMWLPEAVNSRKYCRSTSACTADKHNKAGGSNFVCPDCAKKHTRDSDMWRSLVSEHGDQVPTDGSVSMDELGPQHLMGLVVDDDDRE